jgi:hypothetical protein
MVKQQPINSEEGKRKCHLSHALFHTKSLLEPLYQAEELTKEDYKIVAKQVTTTFINSLDSASLNKPASLSPTRKQRIQQLVNDELNQLLPKYLGFMDSQSTPPYVSKEVASQ